MDVLIIILVGVGCLIIGGILSGILFWFFILKNKEKDSSTPLKTTEAKTTASGKPIPTFDELGLGRDKTASMIEAENSYKEDSVSRKPSSDIFKPMFKDEGIHKADETLKHLHEKQEREQQNDMHAILEKIKNKAGVSEPIHGPSEHLPIGKKY